MRNVRILLVDDHALVRDSLSERLGREPDFSVVGVASDAEEAINLALERNPDIMLMDIQMPGRICFDVAKQISTRCPQTRIIFLSAFCHDRYIEQALDVRAAGYLTKGEPPEKVVEAIRAVAAGRSYFAREVMSRVIVDGDNVTLADKGHTRVSALSSREIEVLRYIARGLSKREIAKVMHLSFKTVDNHTTRLMGKLDIHDRVDLARFAIRERLAEV